MISVTDQAQAVASQMADYLTGTHASDTVFPQPLDFDPDAPSPYQYGIALAARDFWTRAYHDGFSCLRIPCRLNKYDGREYHPVAEFPSVAACLVYLERVTGTITATKTLDSQPDGSGWLAVEDRLAPYLHQP